MTGVHFVHTWQAAPVPTGTNGLLLLIYTAVCCRRLSESQTSTQDTRHSMCQEHACVSTYLLPLFLRGCFHAPPMAVHPTPVRFRTSFCLFFKLTRIFSSVWRSSTTIASTGKGIMATPTTVARCGCAVVWVRGGCGIVIAAAAAAHICSCRSGEREITLAPFSTRNKARPPNTKEGSENRRLRGLQRNVSRVTRAMSANRHALTPQEG